MNTYDYFFAQHSMRNYSDMTPIMNLQHHDQNYTLENNIYKSIT